MAGKVGKYLMFEILGEGAFGKVKLGVHEETGDQVAIKIMDKTNIKEAEMTMNVRREIAIMKALKHRHIVNMHEVLASKTKLYIVMDLVSGGELFTKILNEGKLEEDQARRFFQQMVDGVDYCHRRGICHRDLKPENLLIDDYTGDLKITDFGLSAVLKVDTAEDLLHTQCGSPNYVAPEVIASAEKGYNGAKVDTWSCGIILFALLTGYLPFFADNTRQLYNQIQTEQVAYPSTFPEDARHLVETMLRKNAATRPTLFDVKQHPWFRINYAGDDVAAQNAARPAKKKKKKQPNAAKATRRPATTDLAGASSYKDDTALSSDMPSAKGNDELASPGVLKGNPPTLLSQQPADQASPGSMADPPRDDQTIRGNSLTISTTDSGNALPESHDNADQTNAGQLSSQDEPTSAAPAIESQDQTQVSVSPPDVEERADPEDATVPDGGRIESGVPKNETTVGGNGPALSLIPTNGTRSGSDTSQGVPVSHAVDESPSCETSSRADSKACEKGIHDRILKEVDQVPDTSRQSPRDSSPPSDPRCISSRETDNFVCPKDADTTVGNSTCELTFANGDRSIETPHKKLDSSTAHLPEVGVEGGRPLVGDIMSTDGEQDNMFDDASQLDEHSENDIRVDAASESEHEDIFGGQGVRASHQTMHSLRSTDSLRVGESSVRNSSGVGLPGANSVSSSASTFDIRATQPEETNIHRDSGTSTRESSFQAETDSRPGTSIFKPVNSKLLRKFPSKYSKTDINTSTEVTQDEKTGQDITSSGTIIMHCVSDRDIEGDGPSEHEDKAFLSHQEEETPRNSTDGTCPKISGGALISPITPSDEAQSFDEDLHGRLGKVCARYKAVFQLDSNGRLMGSKSFLRMSMMSLNTLILQGKAVSASWYARIAHDLSTRAAGSKSPRNDIEERELAAFEDLISLWEVRASESALKEWWNDPRALTDEEKERLTSLLAILEVQSVEDGALESITEGETENTEEASPLASRTSAIYRNTSSQTAIETEESFTESLVSETFTNEPKGRPTAGLDSIGTTEDSSYSSTEAPMDAMMSPGTSRFKPRGSAKAAFATRVFGWKRNSGTQVTGGTTGGVMARSHSGFKTLMFESGMSPPNCLIMLGTIFTEKGHSVKKKRGEIRVDISRKVGSDPLQIFCTATNGGGSGDQTRVLFRKGKYDRNKADTEDLRHIFDEVQTAFQAMVDAKGVI